MRAGCTACVQDEAICVADARLRKGVYTYTGSHSKTIVFGLITLDGEGFFQRYGSFTGKEFVEFLKAACERFGAILMITDGAPQHRSKFVREEIGRLDGVELQFLPPGCPDLNAIEEAWRPMKHAFLTRRTSGSAPRAATSTTGWGRPCQNLTSKGTSTEKHRQAPAGAQWIVRTQIRKR